MQWVKRRSAINQDPAVTLHSDCCWKEIQSDFPAGAEGGIGREIIIKARQVAAPDDDKVIVAPFRALDELKDGDPVLPAKVSGSSS